MPRRLPPAGHVLYTLGELIQARRMERGYSQRDLAAVVGIGQRTLCAYEGGRLNPPIDTLIRLAEAADMPLSAYVSPLDGVEVPLRDVRPRKCPPKKT